MRCPSCQAELPQNASFCSKCGQPIVSPDTRATDAGAAAGATAAQELFKPAEGAAADDEAEKLLWEGRYSPRAMVGSWLTAIFGTIAGIVAGITFGAPRIVWLCLAGVIVAGWLYLLCVYLARRLGVHYQLTTHRLVHDAGLLRRVNNRVEVIDMNDITFIQGPVERMLGIGSIRIISSDTTDPTLILHGVEDVENVVTIFDDARRKQRTRHGVHVNRI